MLTETNSTAYNEKVVRKIVSIVAYKKINNFNWNDIRPSYEQFLSIHCAGAVG